VFGALGAGHYSNEGRRPDLAVRRLDRILNAARPGCLTLGDSMNPFLYKAHPLMYRLVDFLIRPSAYRLDDISELALIFLAINIFWALGLYWVARRAAGVRLPFLKSYGLALPATILYAPPLMTVVGDVAAQAFHMEERFLLVFAIFVGSQMLGGFYAAALRQGRRSEPAGLAAGLAVSLFLLLVSVPFSGLLLGLNALLRVI
jgi:hypothetical protein